MTENYVCDPSDKLLEIRVNGPLLRSFSYDSAGRTVSSHVPGVGTTTLDYDFEDRLIRITYPGGATNTYTYNGLGARTQKVDSSGTRNYLRSGASAFSSILSDGAANYTGVISERRGGDSRFYHLDGTPSNGKETNSSESTTSTRTWDAWGNQQSSSGSTQSPFGWGGGLGIEEGEDSGLVFTGGFYYDPGTGTSLIRQIREGLFQSEISLHPGNNYGPSAGHSVSLLRLKSWARGGQSSGRSARPEYYGMLSGRMMGQTPQEFLNDLKHAGYVSISTTADIVTSLGFVPTVAGVVDDGLQAFVRQVLARFKKEGKPAAGQWDHIFQAKRGPVFFKVVEDVGGPEAFLKRVAEELYHLKLPKGIFKNTRITIEGVEFEVQGKVLEDGTPSISSIFVPGR